MQFFTKCPSDSCRACSAKTHPGTFILLASTSKLLPIAQKKAIRVFFLGLQNRKQFCMRKDAPPWAFGWLASTNNLLFL